MLKSYDVAGTAGRQLIATQTAANVRLALHNAVDAAVRRLLCVELVAAGHASALDMLVDPAKAKAARALITCAARLATHGGSVAEAKARAAVATLQREKLAEEMREGAESGGDGVVAPAAADRDDGDSKPVPGELDNDDDDSDDDDSDSDDDALSELAQQHRRRALSWARKSAEKDPVATGAVSGRFEVVEVSFIQSYFLFCFCVLFCFV